MAWKLDKDSEKKLSGVRPELRRLVHAVVKESLIPFAVVSGRRTQKEQDELFAQGRWKPGHIVTWTRHSYHIGGRAIDFQALGKNGKPDWHNLKPYPPIAKVFKKVAKELGLKIEWGGDWKHTKDWGHIELHEKDE